MENPLIRKILEDRPFAGKIAIKDIVQVGDSPEGHALSGTAFWITAEDGSRYKLRACSTEKRAIQIEATIKELPHIFPVLYGRDRNYLLFEALSGYRNVTKKELAENARKIGRMSAEIHQVQAISEHDPDKYFFSRLDWLRDNGHIDDGFYNEIVRAYQKSLAKITRRLGLDLNDIHEGNIMINKEGNILFVDEDGFAFRIKGLGLAKLLKKLNHEGELKEFLAGYTEVANGEFLTPEYIYHLEIVETIRAIYTKLKNKTLVELVPKLIERLKMLVKAN